MPSKHAKLSPSAAARWLNCPFSVNFSKDIKQRSSGAAKEGTTAHSLAEIFFLYDFNQIDYQEYEKRFNEVIGSRYYNEAMLAYINTYCETVEMLFNSLSDKATAHFELEVEMFKDCWGTSDVVIEDQEDLYVIDLKYGKGVPVSAWDNTQLKLYGYGAYKYFGEKHKTLTLGIIQPRVDNGKPSWYNLNTKDLKDWVEKQVIPIAETVDDENLEPVPDGDGTHWCRWCPAKTRCRKMRANQLNEQ